MVYIIIAMFSICILSSICCYNYSHTRPLIQPVRNVSLPIPMMLINSMNNINSMNSMNINLNEECCICLDITPTEKKNETNKNLFINSITMF